MSRKQPAKKPGRGDGPGPAAPTSPTEPQQTQTSADSVQSTELNGDGIRQHEPHETGSVELQKVVKRESRP